MQCTISKYVLNGMHGGAVATAVALALNGCADEEGRVADALGCRSIKSSSQWATPAIDGRVPVHVEVPQPGGWQNSPELAGQFTDVFGKLGQEVAPANVVAVVGSVDTAPESSPTFVAAVFDVTRTRGMSSSDAFLSSEINDLADAFAAGGGAQIHDQTTTTLCHYAARSYNTTKPETPESPHPAAVFNVRALVPAAGRTYEVQVSYSPYDSPNEALRNDFATILGGMKIIVAGED